MKFAVRTLLALALFWPALSHANSVDFSSQGGTLTGSNAGLAVASTTIVGITVGSQLFTGDLGTISFTTGAFLGTGSFHQGGLFAGGGSFVITGNGADGTHSGVIFSGVFSGPVAFTKITLANGTHQYTITGALSGTWFNGQTVDGATVQLTVNTGKNLFQGSTPLASGDTDISGIGLKVATTPEPGTLSLLGTGLFALGGLLRAKLRRV